MRSIMRSDDINIPHLNFQKYFFLLKIRAVHFYETSYVNQAVWKKNFTRTPERITSSISKLHKNRNTSFTVAQDKNLLTFHNLQVTIPKATAIWNSEFILVVSSFPDKKLIEFRFGESVSYNIWTYILILDIISWTILTYLNETFVLPMLFWRKHI